MIIKIRKIISGGQTGADQAGLLAAKESGIETGGWAPKGWRTSEGPAEWLRCFGLIEHHSSEYPPRTRQNVIDSDITLLLVTNKNTPGTKYTLEACRAHHKPYLIVNPKQTQGVFLEGFRKLLGQYYNGSMDIVVNIAGHRNHPVISIVKEIVNYQELCYQFLLPILKDHKKIYIQDHFFSVIF